MKMIPLLALTIALFGTTAAFAHAHLIRAVPPDKAVVATAPTVLTLKFSEGVALKFTGVEITGPDKKAVTLGAESLDPKDDTLLTVPLAGALGAGSYSVAWHALSTDGHKSSGTYAFTVK